MKETQNYSLAMVKPDEDIASDHTLMWVEEELQQKINSEKNGEKKCFYIEFINSDLKGWVASLKNVKMLPFQDERIEENLIFL